MQLKAVRVKGRVYYSIVESVRINGKSRHRYVKYIGSRDKLLESLLRGDDVFKGSGVDVGIQAIFMAINHCVDQVSQNQFAFWYKYTVLEKITGIQAEKLNAENLCTVLDYFYPDGKDKAVEIEKEAVEKLKELFGIKIKMVCLFYDITPTYFEGNETDITTVGRAISRLKNEFSISDCLLIFDRGMVSEDNFVKDLEEGFSLYAVERILELYGKERKVVYEEGGV